MAAYTKNHNQTPGMDESQMGKDRFAWNTTVPLITGGVAQAWDEGGGMEVGLPYDAEVMGEDRNPITYVSTPPRMKK